MKKVNEYSNGESNLKTQGEIPLHFISRELREIKIELKKVKHGFEQLINEHKKVEHEIEQLINEHKKVKHGIVLNSLNQV